jgi:hypothetical protein
MQARGAGLQGSVSSWSLNNDVVPQSVRPDVFHALRGKVLGEQGV